MRAGATNRLPPLLSIGPDHSGITRRWSDGLRHFTGNPMSGYVDYWVRVKRRSRLRKPFTWEIRSSGRTFAVVRSYVPFRNETMARICGERALKRLLQKLNA